jgi:hypothetical protein
MTIELMSHSTDERKVDDAEVQRVVGFIHFVSMETSLIEMTKTWSGADFLYALQRLDVDQPPDRRDKLRELYRNLRAECVAAEAQRILKEEIIQMRAEVSNRLEELKKPHWSIVPNFWVTVIILVLTAIGAIATILALRH